MTYRLRVERLLIHASNRAVDRLINILTATGDGDIERDRKEAERRGFRKITMILDLERARKSDERDH